MEQIKDFFSALITRLGDLSGTLEFADGFNAVMRFVFPVLAFIIVFRCAKSLLSFRREPEIWAWLCLPDGTRLPVTHWENIIGRSKRSDLVIDVATISRSHAVLTRYDDGSWSISDVGSRGGVFVNGERTNMAAITMNDTLCLGGIEMYLEPITHRQEVIQASSRTKAGKLIRPGGTLFLLTLFQALTLLQLLMNADSEYFRSIAIAFAGIATLEWLLFFITRLLRRSGFEPETLAFFLSTIGLSVVASSAPGSTIKQFAAMVLGIILYVAIIWSLRDLERAKKIRYIAAAVGLALLAVNLVFGRSIYGAKNWIMIGGVSFQPSELVKVCFIFAGASTMDRIVTRRNLILFIGYSAIICGALALMSDFGTALIFFICFLVIAYLRSGSFAGIALICAGTGFAGVLAVKFKPYILERFSTWGHIWEDPLDKGFQQTRALMCIASGGLVGLGVGRGWLKYVAASDTDLVFAFVSEEWGLLVALMLVAVLVVLGVFVVKAAAMGRSSFYTIGACAAMSIMITQAILNVFGTVDFLPLTGVTFPFVSNGGSSMMSAWGLLAFIKAADTRQNASFAIKLPSKKEALDE
ncbi:MAG: FtsW/RodA/SpoVE family cell cycle protein [Oscillospiraceae bacterium]|nr:FtsW/RodA/SpoVE family cell cycle protein [Oscillospiraceae bacterium]